MFNIGLQAIFTVRSIRNLKIDNTYSILIFNPVYLSELQSLVVRRRTSVLWLTKVNGGRMEVVSVVLPEAGSQQISSLFWPLSTYNIVTRRDLFGEFSAIYIYTISLIITWRITFAVKSLAGQPKMNDKVHEDHMPELSQLIPLEYGSESCPLCKNLLARSLKLGS